MNHFRWTGVVVALVTLLASFSAPATEVHLVSQEEPPNESEEPWFRLRAVSELGFIDLFHHTIQFGQDGSQFDYLDEGAQDVLFPFLRLSIEADLGDRHRLVFLVQPLDLQTEALLTRDIVVDDLTFPEGTPMDLRYGFTFYRVSYLFDFLRSPRSELAVGASLQLRNATITFTSGDGTLRRVRTDVGPVPILKFRARHTLENGLWFATEIDGFYAPGAIINASDSDVLGAIYDASLRVGAAVTSNIDAYFNLRFFGGGADGTSDPGDQPGDGYTKNWIHLMTVSLGFIYQL